MIDPSRLRALVRCLADEGVAEADRLPVVRIGFLRLALTAPIPNATAFREWLRSLPATVPDPAMTRWAREAARCWKYLLVVWLEHREAGADPETILGQVWAACDTIEGERLLAEVVGVRGRAERPV